MLASLASTSCTENRPSRLQILYKCCWRYLHDCWLRIGVAARCQDQTWWIVVGGSRLQFLGVHREIGHEAESHEP